MAAAFGAAIAAVTTWFASLGPVGQFLVQVTASAAASLASAALLGRGGRTRAQSDLRRELARPNSLTPYRFVYGRRKIYGSPAPYIVKGDILYACFILNSRPSAGGTIQIFVDKRPVQYSGALLDMGTGATATNGLFDDHAKFWVGLGSQTQAPVQLVVEAPELFMQSDAWRGRTVLWARLSAGGQDNRLERWPRVPPEVEVRMNWSLLWDPRDPVQSPTDPDTWTFSANRTLVVLDALMQNPMRAYSLEQVDLQSFITSADVDDQPVPLKAGGTEPRYTAHGLVVWDGVQELEEQIEPIARAGASQPIRIGGKVGMAPGVWEEPDFVITDFVGDDLSFEVWRPGRDLVARVAARYVSPTRDDEMAALVPYEVPGAMAADGGLGETQDLDLGFVTSATQAMRVQQIEALRNRQQRRIAGTLPPEAISLVAGSTVRLDLTAPYQPMNGTYQVGAIAPVVDLAEDGVALRCPVELIEAGASTFNWVPAEDEQSIVDGIAVEPDVTALSPPGVPMLTSDGSTAIDTGEGIVPRILAEWDPSPSSRTVFYEVQFRAFETGPGPWVAAGDVDVDQVDEDGDVFTLISSVTVGIEYEVRVRAVGVGIVSAWVVSDPVTVTLAT